MSFRDDFDLQVAGRGGKCGFLAIGIGKLPIRLLGQTLVQQLRAPRQIVALLGITGVFQLHC